VLIILGQINLSIVAYILIPENVGGIFLGLCLFTGFIFLYMLTGLLSVSLYQRGRRRGKFEEAAQVLKSIFPDKDNK
jgi:hypothetical protein